MRRLKRLSVAAVFATTLAHADERTYDFDCDAPAGHNSSWIASTTASAVVITGTFRVHELRNDKKYLSAAYVYFFGGKDGKTRFGFRAVDVDNEQKKLHLELLKPGGHLDFGDDSLKAGKKMSFRLELSATGTLSVDVGGAKQTTELGAFKPDSVYLGCSTGDFSFDAVRIDEKP